MKRFIIAVETSGRRRFGRIVRGRLRDPRQFRAAIISGAGKFAESSRLSSPQPENIQVGFVALDELVVFEGLETIRFFALEAIGGIVAGDEIVVYSTSHLLTLMIYLIGLAHRVQALRIGEAKTSGQQEFELCLRRAIGDTRAAFVAEEDSEEALADPDRNAESIAQSITREMGIEHKFCDPTQEQRKAIGYVDGQTLQLQIFLRDQTGMSDDEIKHRGLATEIARHFPIRESFWFDHLPCHVGRDGIFICGDAHVDSFSALLTKKNVEACAIVRGLGLDERDRDHYRALEYLANHPELGNA